MAEANPVERDLSPSRQPVTRENLEKTNTTELQKQCRKMGLNRVWVKKDQLISMILQNSQPATTPDAGHLATPAPALSLPADTACLIRPDYTSPQRLNIIERAQSAHTGAAS